MKFERDDAKIGLLVFFAVALFGALLFHRSITAMVKKETTFRVRLENVSDLAEGTEVQLQGLKVGQVNRINLESQGVQYSFVASLGVRPDIRLWQGTKAVVASKGLGGVYVDLQLPEVEARKQLLEANAVLPSEVGASIGTLMDTVQDFVQNLNGSVDDLRKHLKTNGLGAILDHPQVHKVLVDLDGTLNEFHRTATESTALTKQGNETVKSLDRSLSSLEKTMTTLQTIMEKRTGDVDAIVVNLASVLKELQGLSAEIRQLLKGSGPEVDASLKALHRNLQATEELLEILKAKPNRIVWGTPSETEKENAHRRVEAKEKQETVVGQDKKSNQNNN